MTTKILTNSGRNALRDALQSEISDLAVGTVADEPTMADTELGETVLQKTAETNTAGIGEVVFQTRLNTSEANGRELTEIGAKNADDLLARLVFAPVSKTNDFEVEFSLTATVQNQGE